MLSPARSSGEGRRLTTNATIRAAERSDETFLITLTKSAFTYYGSYDAYVAEWFVDPAVLTRIAEISGEPCGFYMLTSYRDDDRPDAYVADLVAIAVAPAFQSSGVGQAMLEHAESESRALALPVDAMWLVVAEGNARAQRFFARNAFRRGGGVGVYPGGQRALRMQKPLPVTS